MHSWVWVIAKMFTIVKSLMDCLGVQGMLSMVFSPMVTKFGNLILGQFF